jgi:hypothetical protein
MKILELIVKQFYFRKNVYFATEHIKHSSL